jgi:[acyl-carrier-protein] S-malonyltransferase
LARAEELAREAGARRVVRLPITIAAHTMLMDSVSTEFSEAIDRVQLYAPRRPVISNVTALPLESPEEIRRELNAQLISPVAWTKSIQYLLDHGADEFVEVGPNDLLLGLVKRINRKTRRKAFDKGPDK